MKIKTVVFFITLFFILSGCNKTDSPILDQALKDLKLPSTLHQSIELPEYIILNDVIIGILWETSDDQLVDLNGNVFRKDTDQTITLTATLTLNEISKVKIFEVLVLGVDSNTISIRTYSDTDEIFKVYYLDKNTMMPDLEEPTDLYATFLGWYTDPLYENELTDQMVLHHSMDLYAKWDIEQYQIEFVFQGSMSGSHIDYIHYQNLHKLSRYVGINENTKIKEIYFDLAEFNLFQKKHKVFVETENINYQIRYYEEIKQIPNFTQIFNQTFGVTEDHHLFSFHHDGSHTVYFDLGQLNLTANDEVIEVASHNYEVFVMTQKGHIFTLYDTYNLGGFRNTEIRCFDKDVEILGDFKYFNLDVAVYTHGFIKLSTEKHIPYIYLLSNRDDQIETFIHINQDYYIMTQNHQVYVYSEHLITPTDYFGNITHLLGLSLNEHIVHIEAYFSNIVFITNMNRSIEFALYQTDSTQHHIGLNVSKQITLNSNEVITMFERGMMITNQNRMIRPQFQNNNNLQNITGYQSISLPMESDETIKEVHYMDSRSGYSANHLLQTNTGKLIIYNQKARAHQVISSLILEDDEIILKYQYASHSLYEIVIYTNKLIYFVSDHTYDPLVSFNINEILNRNDIANIIFDENSDFYGYFMDGTFFRYEEGYGLNFSNPRAWHLKDKLSLNFNELVPLNVSNKAYTDSSWSTAPNQVNLPNQRAVEDVNLYLIDDVNAYEIEFVTYTSQTFNNMIIYRNQSIVLPVPTNKDKLFIGWYLDADLTQLYQGQFIEFGKVHTFYARWENPTYQIIYDDYSGHIETVTMDGGTIPNLNYRPVKHGYNFGGWLDVDGNRFDDRLPRYDDLYLFAKWNPKTVSISATGLNGNSYSLNGLFDDTLESIIFNIPGYQITGFYLDDTFNELISKDILIEENMHLYIDLVALDIPLVLLNEVVFGIDPNYYYVGDELFAKYNDDIYVVNYVHHYALNEVSTYFISQPLNLSSLLELDDLEEIFYYKLLHPYVIIYTSTSNLYLIDMMTLEVLFNQKLYLNDSEYIRLDQITMIRNSFVSDEVFQIYLLSNQDRLFTMNHLYDLTVKSNIQNLYFERSNYVIYESFELLYLNYINNDLKLITLPFERPFDGLPYDQSIHRHMQNNEYYEVYPDGSIYTYRVFRSQGSITIQTYFQTLNLSPGESIDSIFGDLVYTTSHRIFNYRTASKWGLEDYSSLLLPNETIISAINHEGPGVVHLLTSHGRIVDYNGISAIMIENNEQILGYYHGYIITQSKLIYLDWPNLTWTSRIYQLPHLDSIIKIIGEQAITEQGHLINIHDLVNHSEVTYLEFIIYEVYEVIYAPYESLYELPELTDSHHIFLGWKWDDSYGFLITINSTNPIVLYPKWD